jgi:anaerobic magnesium-protoporphyrin IX monomethyl ester cyclase
VASAVAKRVLLLNPPGERLYIRDQFCSHASKGTYYWQPLDLLMIAARLAAEGHQIHVVDAIAERLAPEEAQRRIERFSAEAIVFLTGSDSFAGDMAFVEEARRRGGVATVGIGDILREKGEALMARHPALDACLTDFVTHGLSAFLAGRLEDAENMTVRDGTAIRKVAAAVKPRYFTIPAPPYHLFPLDRYRMPYNRYHPYATVITSTWCPFGCRYCPFARTPYRPREPEDVFANLERIRATGIRQVHIADCTFAVDRRHATAILQGMTARGFGFTWSCLSRVDLMTRELMELMKRAGCDLIEFGVESGNQAILDRYDKGTTVEEIRRTFRWARELELDTLATFVLGLPGDTPETMQQTLDLALEIEPTFCSFNAASPRMGTALRRDMIDAGMIEDRDGTTLDSSRARPVFSTGPLAAQEVERFRRRAIRSSCLRPSYLARRLRRLRSLVELQNHVGNGLSLAWQSLRAPRQ